jgi:cytochrome c5
VTRYRLGFLWIGVGVLVGTLVFATRPIAHALPEYTARTGEACTTCHVNPAGGGPRTERSALWIAEGRPDQVPALPESQEASSSPALDDQALYNQFSCAACHGPSGEGASGPAIDEGAWPAELLAEIIRDGQGTMPGYDQSVLSDDELSAIVRYTQAIGDAEAPTKLEPEPGPRGPAPAMCGGERAAEAASTGSGCGGN